MPCDCHTARALGQNRGKPKALSKKLGQFYTTRSGVLERKLKAASAPFFEREQMKPSVV
jgi:hypothetical protein